MMSRVPSLGIRTNSRSITIRSVIRHNYHISTRFLFSKAPSKEPDHPILKRIPKFLHPYAQRFINAPLSHVTSFIILHELTAIVPLVGFWYLFHKYHWAVPMDLPSWAIEKGTKIIDESMKTFDFSNFNVHERAKFIMEGAYSYVLVKSLFPIRIMISLGLMPSFAKYFVIPITKIFKRSDKSSKAINTKVNTKVDTNVDTKAETIDGAQLKKVKKPRL